MLTGPLIGRDDQVRRLRLALDRLAQSRGGVTLVSGEAGLGKSRLVRELGTATVAGGARLLVGRCYETEQALPLHPWIDALRGDRPQLDPRIRDRLGAPARGQLSRAFPELRAPTDSHAQPSAQHAPLFEALAELVEDLSAERPLVIAIEDLHWSDPMSARLLAFLGARIERRPVLIVGTLRPEYLLDVPALAQAVHELRTEKRLDEISLAPLSEEDSGALLRALLPRDRVDHAERLREHVWALSEGNPFVIVESARAFAAEDPPSPPRGVGGNVREFVTARLDRMSDRARHVVGIAATIGRDFPFALLQHAAHLDERAAADVVEEMVRHRIMDSVGDRLGFCHDVIRQVAHDRVLAPYRPGFHLGIALALEQLHQGDTASVADRLAHHFTQASMPAEAIEYLTQYAERSARLCAVDEAIRALEDALQQVERLPADDRVKRRVELLVRRAEPLSIVGRFDEILTGLLPERVHVDQIGDSALSAAFWCRIALTYSILERGDEVRDAAARAVTEAEKAGNDTLLGRALHILAINGFTMGAPGGIAHAERAIALLRRSGNAQWTGQACWILGILQLQRGDFSAALASQAEAFACATAIGDRQLEDFALSMTAWILLERGDPQAAIERCEVVLARTTDSANGPTARSFLGRALLDLGETSKAIALLEEAGAALMRFPTRVHFVTVMLAEAYVRAGERDRARATIARLFDPATGARSPWILGRARRVLGTIAREEGAVHEAREHFEAALATLGAVPVPFEIARTQAELAKLAC